MGNTESNTRLGAAVEMAMSLLPVEPGCDDCFEYFAAYADHLVTGSEMPAELKMVGEHLERCSNCLEEMSYLIDGLKAQLQQERHGIGQ